MTSQNSDNREPLETWSPGDGKGKKNTPANTGNVPKKDAAARSVSRSGSNSRKSSGSSSAASSEGGKGVDLSQSSRKTRQKNQGKSGKDSSSKKTDAPQEKAQADESASANSPKKGNRGRRGGRGRGGQGKDDQQTAVKDTASAPSKKTREKSSQQAEPKEPRSQYSGGVHRAEVEEVAPKVDAVRGKKSRGGSKSGEHKVGRPTAEPHEARGATGSKDKPSTEPLEPGAILKLFKPRNPQPLTKTQISRQLHLSPDDRSALRKVLRKMEDDGALVRSRGERFVPTDAKGLRKGRLILKEAGFGFVVTEDPDEPDVFIPDRKSGVALNGDRVLVQLDDARFRRMRGGRKGPHHDPKPGERLSGHIVKVLERANISVVGTLRVAGNALEMDPDDVSMPAPILMVPDDDEGMPKNWRELDGMKAVGRLLEWENPHDQLCAVLTEVLGDASDPQVAMLAIIHKYRLPEEFPDNVLAEAESIPEKISASELRQREDLRQELIITIDPDTSKDFDDAITCREIEDGWEISVHIADVSHFVEPGSAIDAEAYKRGNSVYLADRVVPMIPERLSNIICSLQPKVDRCARSMFCKIDKSGRIHNPRFARTVINSKKRLTYGEALKLLEHPERGNEVSDLLQVAWACASTSRKKRFREGSLDLDFPEVKVVYDKKGTPVDLQRQDNDISHQLVEEFMLIANECVAQTLRHQKVPTIYRVHEDPDVDKLSEYRFLLSTFGVEVGDLSQRKEMQNFLESIKGHPEENAMKIGLLKSLKRARYDTEPMGHYGLSKSNYTHFTSPIRRYADLIVHRSLLKLIDSGSQNKSQTPRHSKLQEIAEHISTTERIATDAERESMKLKQLEFLQNLLNAHEGKGAPSFEGVVTDVRKFGFFVEIPKFVLMGFLPIEELNDDYYIHDPALGGFIGRSNRVLVKVGTTLQIGIKHIDMTKKQVEFHPSGPVGGQLEPRDGAKGGDANDRRSGKGGKSGKGGRSGGRGGSGRDRRS